MSAPCGFRPYPGSGAYGHWTCDRGRHHLGRHRFSNYTVPRVPRFWHARSLWRAMKTDRKLRALQGGYSYRRTLFPARYDPA